MKRTLLFFCLCICFLFTCFHRYTPIQLEKVKPTVIQVEVKGAVQHPGVYTLKWNDTVSSLIKASGGLLENGDDSTLSYTRILQDHDVIVVGAKKDNSITLVSINAASLEDLETLPGIGPAIAQRIIEKIIAVKVWSRFKKSNALVLLYMPR